VRTAGSVDNNRSCGKQKQPWLADKYVRALMTLTPLSVPIPDQMNSLPDRPLVVKCTFDKWHKRITFNSARNCSYDLLRRKAVRVLLSPTHITDSISGRARVRPVCFILCHHLQGRRWRDHEYIHKRRPRRGNPVFPSWR
jgi:hypothetical protein